MDKRKFRVGDRVRQVGNDGEWWYNRIGVISEIVDSLNIIEFTDDRPHKRGGFRDDELELVEGGASTVESRKFSKGDRVRIVGESLQAIRDVNGVGVDEAIGTITGVSAWGDDAYGVLADDKRLRSYNVEGTWSVEAIDIEHLDTPAKSSPAEIDIVAALKGDDRKAMNDGTLVVVGEKIDVEAMFYRMCAKTPRRKRKAS